MSSDEDCGDMDVHSTMSREKLRKLTKPLMEKRRRARINSCLNQLKNLVLEAMNQNTSHFSKLEKADILEMTVKHLAQLQRRQAESQKQLDGCGVARFRAGYVECAQEVARCLATVDRGDSGMGMRVMEHLAQRIQISPEFKLTTAVHPSLPSRSPVLRQTPQQTFYLPVIATPSVPATPQVYTDEKIAYPDYVKAAVDGDAKCPPTDTKIITRSPQKSRKSTTPTRFPVSDAYRETPSVCRQNDLKPDPELIKFDQLDPVWRPW